MFRRLAAFGAVLLTAAFVLSARAVSARSYALVDQQSGRLIAGFNYTECLPMASTTKIMTALLACESGRLDEEVAVPAESICVEGSSMGLLAGERITLRELVYGLLLESGNDAANVIAYALGGSIGNFAAMMNGRARQLGLYGTQFKNPSGLDEEGHYTTALDLARLGAFAMNNRDFAAIAGTKKARVSYDGVKNGRLLFNHNRLLGSYEGAVGIKTGFTKKSGRCLVSCARREGVTLVLATLDAPDDWNDHRQLLDYGFGTLRSEKLLASPPRLTAQVVGGRSDTVPVACSADVSAALHPDEAGRVTMQVCMERFYYAPLVKGQKLGELVFRLDGQVVAKTDLLCGGDVDIKPEKRNPILSFFGRIGRFFKSLARGLG